MRTLGITLCLLVLVGGTVLVLKTEYSTYTYRYRMTVEVIAGERMHTGSSVIEVRLQKQPQLLGAPPVLHRISGDAVFVNLDDHTLVIALLTSGPFLQNVDYAAGVIPAHFGLTYDDSDLRKYPELKGRWELAQDRMPALVTFGDVNDPKSARLLQPAEFDRVLGAGVSLKRVWIEMTADPVTRGIRQMLPWLANLQGYTGGQSGPDWSRPERNLIATMFSLGGTQ